MADTYYYPDTPETRNPLIVSTFFGVLALVSFIGRLLSLRIRKERPRLEEYFIVAALILTYASLGLQWACVVLGGTGRHMAEIEPASAVLTLKLIIPFEALYGATLMMVKFSMLCFYTRIFSMDKKFEFAVKVIAAVIFCWMVSVVLETFLLCRPLAYNWDTTIDGVCGNRQAVYVGAAVSNMITDFLVIFLPVPFVWKLRLPMASRIALMGIFCLGIFITAISVVRLMSLTAISFTDPTWTLPMGLLWTVLEPELAIINANLPMLKRLFAKILPKLFTTSRTRSNKSGSGLNKFEKLKDDGIMLRTIGGGYAQRNNNVVVGVDSYHTKSVDASSSGGIVRHTAFRVDVESLSDEERMSQAEAASHRHSPV